MCKPHLFCFLSSATRWCSLNFALQSEPTTKQRLKPHPFCFLSSAATLNFALQSEPTTKQRLKPRLRALRMWLDVQAALVLFFVFGHSLVLA